MGAPRKAALTIMACSSNSTPSGNVRPVYGFSSAEGEGPDDEGPLLFATDGNFYGTTVEGGAHGAGTIFQLRCKAN